MGHAFFDPPDHDDDIRGCVEHALKEDKRGRVRKPSQSESSWLPGAFVQVRATDEFAQTVMPNNPSNPGGRDHKLRQLPTCSMSVASSLRGAANGMCPRRERA